MRYTDLKREFPASNPIANVLVVIAGIVVIAVSVVLGFFAFLALSAIVLVTAAIIGVRVWWLSHKLQHSASGHDNSNAPRRTSGVIEGEFHVVDKDAEET